MGCASFTGRILLAHSYKGRRMSWLEKLLPSKIQQSDPTVRRQMPEGLWIKCPECETVL